VGWIYDEPGLRHHEGYLAKVLEDGTLCASYGGEPGSRGTLPHRAARVCCDCGWQGSEWRAPAGTLWTAYEHDVHEDTARAQWEAHVRTGERRYPDLTSGELQSLVEALDLQELSAHDLRALAEAVEKELARRRS
jgi:hypothetical protein